jgi:hypothetical protein
MGIRSLFVFQNARLPLYPVRFYTTFYESNQTRSARRRHPHGQRLGLAHHEGRRRRLCRISTRVRSERHLRAPHTEGSGGLRHHGGATRDPCHHRRRRRRRSSARGDRGVYHPARHRCSHRKQIVERPGLVALHRADAPRRARSQPSASAPRKMRASWPCKSWPRPMSGFKRRLPNSKKNWPGNRGQRIRLLRPPIRKPVAGRGFNPYGPARDPAAAARDLCQVLPTGGTGSARPCFPCTPAARDGPSRRLSHPVHRPPS